MNGAVDGGALTVVPVTTSFALIASLAAHDRLEKIDIKALRKAYKEA